MSSPAGQPNLNVSICPHATSNAAALIELESVVEILRSGDTDRKLTNALAVFTGRDRPKITGGGFPGHITQIRETYAEARRKAAIMGNSRDAIREAKESVSVLKKALPGFLFSGTFSRRANDGLLEHSGLICVDIDDGAMECSLEETFSRLTASPHLVILFRSPTGAGLKAVFRVPPEASRHMDSCWWLKQNVHELAGALIDVAARDVARLCFASHDPDLYFNPSAQELSPPSPAPKDAWGTKIKRPRAGANAKKTVAPGKVNSPSSRDDECPSGNLDAITSWLRGQIASVLDARGMTEEARNENVSRIVVNALINIGTFYCDAERPEFAGTLFFNRFTKRLESVRSDSFRSWLSDLTALNRANRRFPFVQAAVENAALTGPTTRLVALEKFWASRPGGIYLSCGDGKIVKITGAGVRVVDNGTDDVLFPAGKTLAPWKLTTPADPFVTCDLFRDAHIESHHGRDLLQLWVYSLPTNPRSKPPLVTSGEVRSGKTRTVEGVAELFGIPFIAQSVDERGVDDFWVAVNEGGMFCLDNADTRYRWLADAVAGASTGGCSQRRKLYTNSQTVTLYARAWVAITTANPTFASDAGLADRLLLVRMNRRIGKTSDAALSHQIAKYRDAGMSHIAHTLQAALADTKPVPTGLNKRHPDFAAFAVGIGRALGRESEANPANPAGASVSFRPSRQPGFKRVALHPGDGQTGSTASGTPRRPNALAFLACGDQRKARPRHDIRPRLRSGPSRSGCRGHRPSSPQTLQPSL